MGHMQVQVQTKKTEQNTFNNPLNLSLRSISVRGISICKKFVSDIKNCTNLKLLTTGRRNSLINLNLNLILDTTHQIAYIANAMCSYFEISIVTRANSLESAHGEDRVEAIVVLASRMTAEETARYSFTHLLLSISPCTRSLGCNTTYILGVGWERDDANYLGRRCE